MVNHIYYIPLKENYDKGGENKQDVQEYRKGEAAKVMLCKIQIITQPSQ